MKPDNEKLKKAAKFIGSLILEVLIVIFCKKHCGDDTWKKKKKAS